MEVRRHYSSACTRPHGEMGTYSKKPELSSMNRLRAFPTKEARAKDLVAAAYRFSLALVKWGRELTDNRANPSVVNCTKMV